MAASPHVPAEASPLPNLPDGLTPNSIDVIPILSSLLSRVQTTSTAALNSTSPPAASPAHLSTGTGPLNIKDLPTASDDMKHGLQRARAQVKELPDMHRSIKEQESEIEELEEKIGKQREVLMRLKEMGSASRVDRQKRERAAVGEASEIMET